ncbi:MAG: metal-dependent hydrolase [Anaerolineaceae bacterium]|nr:metal-dependent hydrolase [Anaerolineaceae bacterium]
MAQAGIHGLVGMAVGRQMPSCKGLVLGTVLGSFLPDFDNFAVGVATLTSASTDGLHRTLTHSLFFVLALVVVFGVVGVVWKRPFLTNLGLGLGIGVLLHIALDLLIWFNGVHVMWPLDVYVNLWAGVTPPEWFGKLLMPLENLFFAAYFWGLAVLARRQGTDLDRVRGLRGWTAVQLILFLVFVVLVYTLDRGFLTIYGAVYLVSLVLAAVLTVQLRETVETAV